MLALYELKHHCRTCLMKLETASDIEDPNKYVQICKYPLVQHLMRMCLINESWSSMSHVDADIDELYGHMPNLCGLCFEKWQDFTKLYQLAIRNDEKLRKIMMKVSPAVEKAKECNESNQVYLEDQTPTDICGIEKYETVSPFFRHSRSHTPSLDNREFNISPSPPLESHSVNSCNDTKSECEDKQDVGLEKKSKQLKKTRKRTTRDKLKRKYNTRCSTSSNTINDCEQNSSKRKIYRCEPCKKYFYEILTYEGHMKRIHEGIKRAYQCKECDKAYSLYKNLVGHIAERHSAESQEVHKCEECNKTYKTKTTLKKHLKLQHSQSNEEDGISNSKRVICDQCGFWQPIRIRLCSILKTNTPKRKKYDVNNVRKCLNPNII